MSSSKNPHINELDQKLWEAIKSDSIPLEKSEKKVIHQKSTYHPYRRVHARRILEQREDGCLENPLTVFQGGGKHPKKRRDPEKIYIDARIDLHGMIVEEAHQRLCNFIEKMTHRNARWVLVITGKSGVLFDDVPKWLSLMSGSIVSFQHAREAHGGKGALYVRLKR